MSPNLHKTSQNFNIFKRFYRQFICSLHQPFYLTHKDHKIRYFHLVQRNLRRAEIYLQLKQTTFIHRPRFDIAALAKKELHAHSG